MKNLLLINDTAGIDNWGTEATMDALRALVETHVRDTLLTTIPQYQLTRRYLELPIPFGRPIVVDGESRGVGRLRGLKTLIARVGMRMTDSLFPVSANSVALAKSRWVRSQRNPLVADFARKIEAADAVIYNGELLNFALNPVSSGGMFLTLVAKKVYGKPSGVINQTTPSVDGDFAMIGLLRKISPVLDLVTVREPASKRAMDAWGIDCELVPDPVFWLKTENYDFDGADAWLAAVGLGGSPYFCISLSSGLPLSGGKDAVVDLILALQRVVPNAVLLGYGGGAWLLRKVANEIEHCYFFEGDYQAVWPLLKQAEFLVSGHYHDLIMSAMVGCPFVAFEGLSHKIPGLLSLLGWTQQRLYNLTCLDLEIEAICEDVKNVLMRKTQLQSQLLDRASELGLSASRTGKALADLLP